MPDPPPSYSNDTPAHPSHSRNPISEISEPKEDRIDSKKNVASRVVLARALAVVAKAVVRGRSMVARRGSIHGDSKRLWVGSRRG